MRALRGFPSRRIQVIMCARAGAAVSVRGRARSIHDVIPKLARSKKVGVIVFVPMLFVYLPTMVQEGCLWRHASPEAEIIPYELDAVNTAERTCS